MSTQESKDARLHITSLLDEQTETRIIRNHRRPSNHRARRVIPVLMLSLLTGSVSAVDSHESADSAPVTSEPTVVSMVPEVKSAPHRTMVKPASRSARVKRAALSRPVRINRAIAFGMAQRGDRYQWGAAGPNRWDCSGLTMKSFAKAGVKLPHYTGALLARGKRISRASMRPGDLIFPSRGHVGIYVGGGKMLAASSGKGRVIVQKVYGFYAARRVL